MESNLSKQTHNHMRAPKSASFVANMRKAFGADNVAVTYVKENDVLLGEEAPVGAPVWIEERKAA